MNEKIKGDILSVLHQIVKFLDTKDSIALSELSNHTIHNASIYQDIDSNQIAVVTYALSKIVERSKDGDFGAFRKKFIMAMEDLQAQNQVDYRSKMREIILMIGEMDSKLQAYIGEVIETAKIKKGSKIYDHGVSLSRVSEILGISQWDLMKYVGQTKIIDRLDDPAARVQRRLEIAREVLK